ncbi:MAG: threonylcarbamoyl-AMP synthase [Elusimicrobiaceae bacterium]|nr:threonylcarbamoyl-AMP synthase [Elusimicrobiaceae bacterium]
MNSQDMRSVAAEIDAGAVVAFPTDTVYGIGANAFDEKAIARIYEIKDRPAQSALQILVGTVAQAQEITQWTEEAEKLAHAFWPGALTMVLSANEKGKRLLRGFAGLGLRVPAHRKLAEILALMSVPLASTSANSHGKPVITQEETLLDFLTGKADIILLGGACTPVPSSVVDMTGAPAVLREGAVTVGELEKILNIKVG